MGKLDQRVPLLPMEPGSVDLTTNLEFEQWTDALLSVRFRGATLDRLTHRYSIVGISGDSYHLQGTRRQLRCSTNHAKRDSSVINERTEG